VHLAPFLRLIDFGLLAKVTACRRVISLAFATIPSGVPKSLSKSTSLSEFLSGVLVYSTCLPISRRLNVDVYVAEGEGEGDSTEVEAGYQSEDFY
jgi:hypothetical protein